MKLLIDIGNTRSKYIIVKDALTNIRYEQVVSIDNTDFIESYFEEYWCNVDQIVIACVNDDAMIAVVSQWAQKSEKTIIQVKTQQQAHGVTCAYEAPQNLGVDRWLALIGARTINPQKNCLIIDAGTAITFDLLESNGVHNGGWIVPGVDLLYKTLMSNTANIKANKISTADLSFGKSSAGCVNNGIWAMVIGVIEQAIKEAQSQLTIDEIILCGGNAKAIITLARNDKITLIEELIFKGLQRYIDNISD